MRKIQTTALGLVGGIAMLGLALNGPQAFAAATIGTVSPSTGLATGDTVTVSVTGLDPSKTYMVGQCKDFALPPTGSPVCNFGSGAHQTIRGEATKSVTITVSQQFTGGHGNAQTAVNCKGAGPDQCVVALVEHPVGGPPSGPLEVAKSVIAFG